MGPLGMNGEDVVSNRKIFHNLADGTAIRLFSAKNDTQIKQALEFWITVIRDSDTSPTKNILKKDPFSCIHLCDFIILPVLKDIIPESIGQKMAKVFFL